MKAVVNPLSILLMLQAGLVAGLPPNPRPGIQALRAPAVAEYESFLRALEIDERAALRARDELIRTFSRSQVPDSQAAFRLFRTFHAEVGKRLGAGFDRSPAARVLDEICPRARRCPGATIAEFSKSGSLASAVARGAPTEDSRTITALREAGFAFQSSEGMWYLIPDPSFLSSAAAMLPLGELAEWVRFWEAESPQITVEDESLLITWDELRLRLTRWEAFARIHPSLPETRDEVIPHVRQLAIAYVCGTVNTRPYGRIAEKGPSSPAIVDPALKASYVKFLAGSRESGYSSLISGIVTRLARSRDELSDDLRAFLKSELKDAYAAGLLDALVRPYIPRDPVQL